MVTALVCYAAIAIKGLPMADPRRHAHQLIDRLPETQLSVLVGLPEAIVDPRLSKNI